MIWGAGEEMGGAACQARLASGIGLPSFGLRGEADLGVVKMGTSLLS